MNIFSVDDSPEFSAMSLVDSHVVKMILETAQLLSTAHRVLDGVEYTDKSKTGRNIKRWKLNDSRDTVLYSATHVSHPSAVWVRETSGNYDWLYFHFLALLKEYTFRYGKQHKCAFLVAPLVIAPYNLKLGRRTEFACAMPDEYKISYDAVTNYRDYYARGKKHLHKWTKRERPEWIR